MISGGGWYYIDDNKDSNKKVLSIEGNNGSVSCDSYCEGRGGGKLPDSWKGAKCVKSGFPNIPCSSGIGGPILCTCEKTGTGWK